MPLSQGSASSFNLKITLWGVQGSFPVSSSPQSLEEYSKVVSRHVIDQMLIEIQKKGTCSAKDLLNGVVTPDNVEAFQNRLGLPTVPLFGGDTTCLEIQTGDNQTIIIDAGSGLRRCSQSIVRRLEKSRNHEIHLIASHEHLDHRCGLPFARFCYIDENPYQIHIHAPRAFLRALDDRYGIFSRKPNSGMYFDDPIDYTFMPAKFEAMELLPEGMNGDARFPWMTRDLSPFEIGKTTVTPFVLYHVNSLCLGYRFEHNGKVFVFATDHERRKGAKADHPRQIQSDEAHQRVLKIAQNADLAYFDGQYRLNEYLGMVGISGGAPMKHLDWGHGCVEDVMEIAKAANIHQTLVGHHDPDRSWSDRAMLDQELRQYSADSANPVQLSRADDVFIL